MARPKRHIKNGAREVLAAFPGSGQALSDDVHWVLGSGVQWGPVAGGGTQELWRWDGERASLLEAIHFQF